MTGPIWRTIKETLGREIAEGRFPQGSRLPTEADLSVRFAVNRHTVRRALGALRDEGVVHSRRGAGVFVATNQFDYRLGQRTRFTQGLAAEGLRGAKRLLRLERAQATARDAEQLLVEPGAPVVVLETLGLVDDAPTTLGHSLLPVGRLPGIEESLRTHSGSVTAALSDCGIADYRRAWTRITAERASATHARHLEILDGAPLIRTRSLNVDAQGQPVELGRTYFCADRVELLVEPGT